MDADHNLYRLSPYDAGDGYQSYTSNEPQTYADKIISWMSSADRVVRIPPNGNPRNNREVNNDKERFIIGALRAANERLANRLLPNLQSQLAWYITLRGWYAGRALLVKTENSTTHIDITPWDPMHTYWGTDGDGLAWACYKMKKTRVEIESQYNVRLGTERMDEDGIDVYDFYDREDNFVAVPHRFIKKRTAHGGTGVPVFMGPVGANPLIQSLEWSSIEDTVGDYGESVFKSTRDLYENHNFMMSVMLELTARSRKQGLKITSRDGQKTLEEDPYKEGTEISLAQGEDVEPLGLMEVARETGAYMGLVSGEIQRGSIPHSVYGELQFQLSGFAINTLRQGVETVLTPRIIALENAYRKICNLLCDQYSSGAFSSMELSGRDNNRMYFSETITPERVKDGGEVEISVVPRLPQDDMSKYSMAQIARDGPTPLMPDLWIRDNILGVQDADQTEDAIKEQIAERTLPEAAIWTLYQASLKQGREDLARFYAGELTAMLLSKAKMLADNLGGGAPPGPSPGALPPVPPGAPPPGGPQGGPPGVPPGVAPPAMMTGMPPPAPTPQAGPNVPPGQARPGAQGNNERLRRMGLVGPGG
tara:strand:+ start:782 stop:2560 length:1779 start_codon:yes stop_codon:yes gene_type:complete